MRNSELHLLICGALLFPVGRSAQESYQVPVWFRNAIAPVVRINK